MVAATFALLVGKHGVSALVLVGFEIRTGAYTHDRFRSMLEISVLLGIGLMMARY